MAGVIDNKDLRAALERRERAVASLTRRTSGIPRVRLVGLLTATMPITELEKLLSYQQHA